MTRVLIVDNHDSFVHTLRGYLHELGAETDMVEADAIADVHTAIEGYGAVLISPGPGGPDDAGASVPIVHACAAAGLPLLGVCLGHQAIAQAYGATIGHAPELMHGMVSAVHHDGGTLYAGIPSPFDAGRYHSLAIVEATLPPELVVSSRTASGVIMGVTHRSLPIHGVQFHPESVLTDRGYRLLGNWLQSVGIADAAARGARLHPHRGAPQPG